MDLQNEIERAVGQNIGEITPLGGGCIGSVYRFRTPDGDLKVAKVDDRSEHPSLDVEGFMLDYLRQNSELPVPQVVYSRPDLLILNFIEGGNRFSEAAEQHAAELLADLHGRTAEAYGFERPTLIGGLHQPNDWSDSWIEFFGEQRLLNMANKGYERGRLSLEMAVRIERLVQDLDQWLSEPRVPSLVHGDVWTTNVLAQGSQIRCFLDPAIYYGSPEVELAFIGLFNTFGQSFYERYHELRAIEAGFFEIRRDIYNLYPLLVHVRLFGGGYESAVDKILQRFGY